MTHRNRIAVFVWGFTAVWIGMLAVMTTVMARDGFPGDHGPVFYGVVFALFWAAGIALAGHALSQPCTAVRLLDDGTLHVTQRFPLRRIEHRFAAQARPALRLVETTDSDGDPYFVCELAAAGPFERPVRVAEGPREHCEAVLQHLAPRA